MADREDILRKVKNHLRSIQSSGNTLLIRKCEKVVKGLEDVEYSDEDLIDDLQTLGFQDLAKEVRQGRYA